MREGPLNALTAEGPCPYQPKNLASMKWKRISMGIALRLAKWRAAWRTL